MMRKGVGLYDSLSQNEPLLDSLTDLDPSAGAPPLLLKVLVAGGLRRAWSALPAPLLPLAHGLLCSAASRLPGPLRIRALGFAARLRADVAGIERDYPEWTRLYDQVDAPLLAKRAERLDVKPLISIVMPVFNPDPKHLRATIGSVLKQAYPNWELCIADDRSTDPAIAIILREAQARDPRVRLVWRDQNGHISAASNSALSLAAGVFVVLLDHDDLLAPDALLEVAGRINIRPDADILYSDEDHIDDTGRRSMPYFKPDWNPELMLGHNLISHMGVYRRSLIERIGGFRIGLEGSQDYDLALRAVAATRVDRIVHIPRVLYHWRQGGAVRSFSEASLGACAQAGRLAVAEFLGGTVDVQRAPRTPAWNRVIYPIPAQEPLVSVVIPTRDRADLLGRTMEGLLRRTEYAALEVLIVDNDSREPAALDLMDRLAGDPRVRVLRQPGAFNYAALNNAAVREARGELVLLLNNDIEVINPDWLREMVSHAVRPGIGAVGAKLLYPNGKVQHAGVTLGMFGVAGHPYVNSNRADPGYFGHLSLARNVSAVTGACMLLRRAVYDEAGGLDETALPVAFNDIDLCLKLMQLGYRNVWTPFAELYHHESASRGGDRAGDKAARFRQECATMRHRWGAILRRDPYWNPNLSLHNTSVALAFPPRGFD